MPQDIFDEHRALFIRDGEQFVPTPLARGPWDPNALHGGAPSALFAWAVERHDPGDASFLARLTVELLRPVPLAPLQLSVRTSRPGRKVQWIDAALWCDGNEVARASALRVHTVDIDAGPSGSPAVDAPPTRHEATAQPFAEATRFERVGFWSANEVALVRGAWGEPGPGTAWFRLLCPVVEGEAVSGAQRTAAAADFGSGIGNPVDFTMGASAINPDLSIHWHRHPVGEWVCLESIGWAGAGAGMAETRLFDEHGVLGRSVQTLLVQPMQFPMRPPPAEDGGVSG